MPKMVTPNSASALQITAGANYYHLIGIEFFAAPGIYIQDVIQAGNGTETSVDQLPHDIDFDRDYIHSDFPSGWETWHRFERRQHHSSKLLHFRLLEHLAGQPGPGRLDGPGPYTITNNYLEAGTESSDSEERFRTSGALFPPTS